jgi:murein DD-endopeptidase MepM/ murein hydrolase activator NlpD
MNRRTALHNLALASLFPNALLRGQQGALTPAAAPERKLNPFLTLPVRNFRVTEGWEYDAEAPFHPETPRHYAIDFQTNRGTPVYAAADGMALQSFHTSYLPNLYKGKRLGFGLGHFVQIWHPNAQVYTAYCHLDRVSSAVPYIAPKSEHEGLYSPEIVYASQKEVSAACKLVRQGQLIGYVGDTGLSDEYTEKPDVVRDHSKLPTWDPAGPHLHFEVYARGSNGFKDPAQRWDPYGIYGKAADYKSGRQTATGLWLLNGNSMPKFVG